MSEPMRFSLKHHGQLSCVEHCPEGEYVFYLDYARLKAEVERLDSLCDNLGMGGKHTIMAIMEENARLKAEVERIEPELEQRCRELNLSIAQQAIQLRQIGELKAEVERLTEDNRQLTKAFEIAEGIIKRMGKEAEDAAKEGKPSV